MCKCQSFTHMLVTKVTVLQQDDWNRFCCFIPSPPCRLFAVQSVWMGRLMIGWFNVNDLSNSDKSSSFLIMSLGPICDIQMTGSKFASRNAEVFSVVHNTRINNWPNYHPPNRVFKTPVLLCKMCYYLLYSAKKCQQQFAVYIWLLNIIHLKPGLFLQVF